MLKNIAIFLAGLFIGATYPNEARYIVKTTLNYLKNAINNMQSNIHNINNSKEEIPYNIPTNQNNNKLVKELPKDWK